MLLIFDLDDTLIYTHRVFMRLTDEFLARMAAFGFDDGDVYATMDEIDRGIVTAADAYVPWAFPTAMRRTYRLYCQKYGVSYDAAAADGLERLGNGFRETAYQLLPGAKALLEQLSAAGHKLALLTQGDYDVQYYKIRQHDLARYFAAVKVVAKKTPAVYNELMREYGFAPADTAVIGNSLKSEIAPALAVGARPILVTAAESWSFEETPVAGGYAVAQTLAEVAELLR